MFSIVQPVCGYECGVSVHDSVCGELYMYVVLCWVLCAWSVSLCVLGLASSVQRVLFVLGIVVSFVSCVVCVLHIFVFVVVYLCLL